MAAYQNHADAFELKHTNFSIETNGQGLFEFTRDVENFIANNNVEDALLTLFVRHTSCSLIIQENADRDVQKDLQGFFTRLVPENMDWISHTCEGPDDMPAHIKAALNQVSIGIPIVNGRMVLGTWQGIYLFEHRTHPHSRQVIAMLNNS